jgi:hypothetical protein
MMNGMLLMWLVEGRGRQCCPDEPRSILPDCLGDSDTPQPKSRISPATGVWSGQVIAQILPTCILAGADRGIINSRLAEKKEVFEGFIDVSPRAKVDITRAL